MELHEYINQYTELYNKLLSFINEEDNMNFDELVEIFNNRKYEENRYEFKQILYLILNISNNHHRNPGFFDKINQILLYFAPSIKQSLSNLQIFQFFQRSKQILLFLFKQGIIKMDEDIYDTIKSIPDYQLFFFPEIKEFAGDSVNEIEKNILSENPDFYSNFEKKRQLGENDTYICSLIRNDLVDEFIPYMNKINISLSSKIKYSFFETNNLLKLRTDLIEYAAFFGSIQIFNYLRMNGVPLDPNLWIYAIHSQNPEIIHLLESNGVEPIETKHRKKLDTISEFFFEAIECHHNKFADYILDNMVDTKDKNTVTYQGFLKGIKCHNYLYFQNAQLDGKIDDKIISHFCEYDYLTIIQILLKENKIDINANYDRETLLRIAVENFNIDIINFLMSQKGIEIGPQCFDHCSELHFFNIDSPYITEIRGRSFTFCQSLKSVTITSPVTEIGPNAFSGCSALKEIVLPPSITCIGESCFDNCTSLEEITIPNLVKEINNNTFRNCTSLKKIELPANLTSIKNFAFFHCSSLEQVSIPSTLTSIGLSSFESCTSLTEISLLCSVKVIKNECFNSCTSLKKVVLPNELTSIRSCAFVNCRSLEELTLPSSLKTIGNGAFNGCTSLKHVFIPANITNITKSYFPQETQISVVFNNNE